MGIRNDHQCYLKTKMRFFDNEVEWLNFDKYLRKYFHKVPRYLLIESWLRSADILVKAQASNSLARITKPFMTVANREWFVID